MGRRPDLKIVMPQKLAISRAKSASREPISKYYQELGTILTINNLTNKPNCVQNFDETRISTERTPPKVVCDKNTNLNPSQLHHPGVYDHCDSCRECTWEQFPTLLCLPWCTVKWCITVWSECWSGVQNTMVFHGCIQELFNNTFGPICKCQQWFKCRSNIYIVWRTLVSYIVDIHRMGEGEQRNPFLITTSHYPFNTAIRCWNIWTIKGHVYCKSI